MITTNKIILLFTALLVVSTISFAQASNEKMIFVIDSIPLINNPEEWNEILDEDIADVRVIKNKDSLKLLGFERFDGVTYVFTKEYRNRPDSIKQIPSLKQMKMENEVWYFQGVPYTGKYIDYYNCGLKQNEGMLINGKPNGEMKVYFKNGQLGSATNYREGIRHGTLIEYYKNGSLRHSGEFKEGRDEGLWESYFPDGQLERRVNIKNGKAVDTAIAYYSTGKVNNKAIPFKTTQTINYLQNKVYENLRAGDNEKAIKFCSKIIELDSVSTDAYSSKGRALLNEFQYDEAIAAFDKALSIEPLTQSALIGRAMARINKYEIGSSRTVSKNKEITVLAAKNAAPVPQTEEEKICADLLTANLLQTIYLYGYLKSLAEPLLKYCHVDIRR